MDFKRCVITSLFLTLGLLANGQSTLTGKVLDGKTGLALTSVSVLIPATQKSVITNSTGGFKIKIPETNTVRVKCFYLGYERLDTTLQNAGKTKPVKLALQPKPLNLNTVDVRDGRVKSYGRSHMRSIQGTAIYAGKKTEVLEPGELNANLATNNPRQVFSKVAGLNIWESDESGIQLDIGVRGLSPNRTSNINMRQNGYDISADALGYPESYYTPPLEAVKKIEYVRGAASLQYGPQFGGMMNFALKKGPKDDPFEVVTRQTAGSYGLFNSFNSAGGSKGNSHYYGFIHYKRGDGWRDNSGFNALTGHASYSYDFSEKLSVGFEYTAMRYLAKQPGGLTDRQFEENPQASYRNRNWFKVNWNLAALKLDWKLSTSTTLNSRFFGLLASRKALGYLGEPGRIDEAGTPRDLIYGNFKNIGNETRLLQRYDLLGQRSALLLGFRFYKGNTHSRQGKAGRGNEANFHYLEEPRSISTDYDNDNYNAAAFAENVFYLGEKLTITPGGRLEYIDTRTNGFYRTTFNDLSGNLLEENINHENRARNRTILLGGIGLSYKPLTEVELYANFSQNYRAINYRDMRISKPSFQIDPQLRDERGYNTDIGIRGQLGRILNYDLSAYILSYSNRIGSIQKRDPDTYRVYRLRTNVADSRSSGVEAFAEFSPFDLFGAVKSREFRITLFSSFSYTDAIYCSNDEPAFDGNRVELVPGVTSRSGLSVYKGTFKATAQFSYVSEQYSDATNAEFTTSGVNGIVPAYQVIDLSGSYTWRKFTLEAGINNLLDGSYFTRRAAGYPGPGIIPSEGRTLYLTVGARF